MKLVVIESPYAGDVERNLTYARACMKDSINRGEAPIASHLLYTQEGLLDDTIPAQRELGCSMGLLWARQADLIVFYVDKGWSRGMMEAKMFYAKAGIETVNRELPNWSEIKTEKLGVGS